MISMHTSKTCIVSFLFLLRAFNCRGIFHVLDAVLLSFKFVSHVVSPLLACCSEEIRGEVLFVLYKLYVLQSTSAGGDGSDMLIPFCPQILYLLVDVLMKTQNDDVRLNCVGPLSIPHYFLFLENNI